MYNSSYFSNIRNLNIDNSCSSCKNYKICKSGCIGQKIIANYIEDKGKMSNEDIIKYMYEHQDEEFKRLDLDFKRIGNRPLQLIYCQNIFCELDKYCRQALNLYLLKEND